MAIVMLSLLGALAQATVNHSTSRFLRNSDGSLLFVRQYEAMKACPQGMHLPTIRELAKISVKTGAEIFEMDYHEMDPDSKVPTQYFDKVSAVNPNGKKDDFYLIFFDYKFPKQGHIDECTWSSSLTQGSSEIAYCLNGARVGTDDTSDTLHAVICVPNRH